MQLIYLHGIYFITKQIQGRNLSVELKDAQTRGRNLNVGGHAMQA